MLLSILWRANGAQKKGKTSMSSKLATKHAMLEKLEEETPMGRIKAVMKKRKEEGKTNDMYTPSTPVMLPCMFLAVWDCGTLERIKVATCVEIRRLNFRGW